MAPAVLCAFLAVVPHGGVEANGGWRSPAARCEAMAEQLRISPSLRPLVVAMCRRAPTFRAQVARLASAPDLAVTVTQAVFPAAAPWRAHTAIRRIEGRLQSADVVVSATDAPTMVQLVAHEFEHIIEQLDGVDLARWIGRSGVHRVAAGGRDAPIETARAEAVGRLVAREFAQAPEMALTSRAR
jgi:hypothetical protein